MQAYVICDYVNFSSFFSDNGNLSFYIYCTLQITCFLEQYLILLAKRLYVIRLEWVNILQNNHLSSLSKPWRPQQFYGYENVYFGYNWRVARSFGHCSADLPFYLRTQGSRFLEGSVYFPLVKYEAFEKSKNFSCKCYLTSLEWRSL